MEKYPGGNPRTRPRALAALAPCIAIAALLLAVRASRPAHSAPVQSAPEQAIRAPLAGRSLLLDAAATDGALLVVGERGHILISGDEGETWQQTDVPTRSALTGVYFHDRERGWAVGHDAVILRTTDGGVTWERAHWAPEEERPLFDVWFADPEKGFAIGAYGSLYVTSDGGASWVSQPLSEDELHLHQLARSASGRLYIAAEAGMVYSSEDGGESWAELPSPYEGSFFGVLPLDDDVLLLFGLQGHLFRSEDAGQTWMVVETGTTVMLTAGVRLGDGTILVTGLGGVVLVSRDGGRTFVLLQQPDRRGISAVVEMRDGRLLMVGEFGVRTVSVGDLTK